MNNPNFATDYPKLGFGMMRMPEKDGVIDFEQVCKMADAYVNAGFCYFDTAWMYHGGESEKMVKKAIVERYPRENIIIASKLPGWDIKQPEDCQRIFDIQLEKTGAGYFDMYLLHAVDHNMINGYEANDCFAFCQKMKAEGKIKHFGFSFHDSAQVLDDILTRHPEVEFVQLQINYLDWDSDNVQSGQCYHVARKHQKPIVVMEPVKGGKLADYPPTCAALLKQCCPNRSIASWAIRFVAGLPGVMTVLSGMSNEEQMMDNIRTCADFQPLSMQEKAVLDDVLAEIKNLPVIPCTACHYCTKGCPKSLMIPEIISATNDYAVNGDGDHCRNAYGDIIAKTPRAKFCLECGQCNAICPQHIDVMQAMKQAAWCFDRD